MLFFMPFSIKILLIIPILSKTLQFLLNSILLDATAAIHQTPDFSSCHLSSTVVFYWINEYIPPNSLVKSLMNILKNGGSNTDFEGNPFNKSILCQQATANCSAYGWETFVFSFMLPSSRWIIFSCKGS